MSARRRRDRSRAGLTLVEMLVSLALLSGLLLGTAWWTREGAATQVEVTRALRFDSAASALLDAIGRDLLAGDFFRGDRAAEAVPKVAVRDRALEIRTRPSVAGATSVLREDAFHATTGELVLTERPDAGAKGVATRPSVVLGDVAEWLVTLDAKRKLLDVTAKSAHGRIAQREYTVP